MHPPSFKTAYTEAVEFFHLNPHSTRPVHNSIMVNWIFPHRNTYKLNIDGFNLVNPGKGGIGFVIRNFNGDWVLSFSQIFFACF